MSATKARLLAIETGVPTLGPETIHIDITNSCNTNCVTCWDHSPHLTTARPAAWKRQRQDLASVTALLDDAGTISGLGVPEGLRALIVSGMGDPLTHPDALAMIGAAKARGLHVTVITNLLAADADALLASGVDELLIGIHAASEAAYLAFHPSFRPADWQRLHAMLARFREAGRRFKHVHVICRHNAHELPAMIVQASRAAASQVNFKLASLQGGTEVARITGDQRRTLLGDAIPEARELAGALGVLHNLDVFEAQLQAGGAATADIAEVGCFVGTAYSRVLVDGTVLYCCNTDVVVGRLGPETPFSSVWTGPAWTALRARLRRGDYFESCRQCGKFNQNVKWSDAFRRRFGDERWRAVIGRGAGAP
ncbi:MAG: radical SAM protein [Myxococcales bacterium]|nr:radical SAM protein [Myxococcales bacterium]